MTKCPAKIFRTCCPPLEKALKCKKSTTTTNEQTHMAMNQQAMLKQVKKMQKKMEEIQAATALETVEASAGGGMVVATVSGDLKVKDIKIDPEALDPEDVEMLQDMIVAAVNQGLEDAQELASKRMSAVTGGMNIPGLF